MRQKWGFLESPGACSATESSTVFCHKAINSEKLTEKEEKPGTFPLERMETNTNHPLPQIVHNNKPQAVKPLLQLALLLSQTAACTKTFGLYSAGCAPLSVCHLTHVVWQVVPG